MPTHTYNLRRPLPTSTSPARARAISLLHHHANIITLSPLVVSYTASPPSQASNPVSGTGFNSTTYTITDAVAYLPFGLYTGHVSLTAEFTDTDNGVTTMRQAPMGFAIRELWAVREAEGIDRLGVNELVLEVELSAGALVLLLFKRMMESNHAGYVDRMLKIMLEARNARES